MEANPGPTFRCDMMWTLEASSALRTDFTGKQETSGVQQLINKNTCIFIYIDILNKGKGVID